VNESKRRFIKRSVGLLASGLVAGGAKHAAAAEPPEIPPSMKGPGAGMGEYGSPAKYESKVTRTFIRSQPGTTGSGASRTPLESLDGMITPSGLHFERHHSGVPDIDPAEHRLLVHGMVRRPLIFTVDALLRYPMISRIHFLECSGNSQLLYQPAPPTLTAGQTHGLVSCSEWTGVPLRVLLEEAGVDRSAQWILAEGADGAAMSRSIPMAKAMDDAILALFQNGERLRPENGYPVRLFLPGWEGNMSVKWLRRLKVVPAPIMTKDETSRYSDLQSDGKALMFTYPMEVKSVITRPSHGMTLPGRGLHQISGIAWSATARSRRSRSRPMQAGPGSRRRWSRRCCRARSRASGCPGDGTARRPCSSRAPPTTPAPCSRSARSSSPSTATTRSSISTASRPGAWRRAAR